MVKLKEIIPSTGFNSLFLLRRHYRCYTTLAGFSFDDGNVERRKDLSLEDFRQEFDVNKPVLLSGLADTWPAKRTWTIDQLLLKYGDTAFKISHKSARKISMKLKDYVSYTQIQHDEDLLYIFDGKFGEVAPALLNDYRVPHLFHEDHFDILDRGKWPAFRWLIIGPERSGASWHVDPALTSAWNTLLCGRKRCSMRVMQGLGGKHMTRKTSLNVEGWALYPPGRVPLGVTVHWWLDFYPLLADEDKPIECTQLLGETIFVPSGWWHCVLNLETTVAVTQNFVNSTNFEFVCLDMASGYQHKGVSRAGLLALDEGSFEDAKKITLSTEDSLSNSDLTRKEKRVEFCEPVEEPNCGNAATWTSISHNVRDQEFSYNINFLEMFLDKGRDHYNSLRSSSNCIGQREMRAWLWKLWVEKPGMRNLIWKGACLALNAGKWSECIREICTFHKLSFSTDDERLPVGMGSNPVYLLADHVVKLYVKGGLEASLHALGSELEFYNILCKVDSPLKNHIPGVLASGILSIENGSYKIVPWHGKGVLTRDTLSWEDTLRLASFLGEQLHNLHLLPFPSLNASVFPYSEEEIEYSCGNGSVTDKLSIQTEWDFFIRTLTRRKKDVSSRLAKWGDPIPSFLIDKVDEYIPDDFAKFLNIFEDGKVGKPCSWIHSDIMDDNIHMEPSCVSHCPTEKNSDTHPMHNSYVNGYCDGGGELTSWRPSHILDFSDLSMGNTAWPAAVP
ncbi:transferases, transferring glycosyl groups [Actinidia rufa]|uniref:Transferases, transferring glycosyl groups n=1 Tax=Actinidia rufa TaxID=165716 RepID=A0A7J0EI36_9ERIC|nr:transferases, transferring glycosyl groups [Actinidia rufa]